LNRIIPPGQKPVLDWQSVVGDMSSIERSAFESLKWSRPEEADLSQFWYGRNVQAAKDTLNEEVAAWGCDQSEKIGRAMKGTFRESAKRSAKSIVNTHNYHLAHEVRRIGAAHPGEDLGVYLDELEPWTDQSYGQSWADGVATTETYGAIGFTKGKFYANNRALRNKIESVEIQPADTVCQICADAVAGNPYNSWSAAPEMPAHIRCPHYKQAIPKEDAKVDCGKMWVGD
jgi:erythromycin esterase-like protein